MHPSLEELLAIRDGEAPGPIGEHLEGCDECRGEMARLVQVKERLQALPEPEPPRDLWPAIREAALRERRKKLWVRSSWAALLVAGAVAGSLLLTRPTPVVGPTTKPAGRQAVATGTPAVAKPPAQVPAGGAELASLIRRSQNLEEVLRRVDRQPRVQDGWEAAAITELQDRVAMVDGRISQAKGQNSSKELVGLWQQRVRLLNALVKVQVDPRGTAQI